MTNSNPISSVCFLYSKQVTDCSSESCRIESSKCRKITFHILTGCFLYVWDTIRELFKPEGKKSKTGKGKIAMQLVRIDCDEKGKFMGVYLPRDILEEIKQSLKELYEHPETKVERREKPEKVVAELMEKLDNKWKAFRGAEKANRKRRRDSDESSVGEWDSFDDDY